MDDCQAGEGRPGARSYCYIIGPINWKSLEPLCFSVYLGQFIRYSHRVGGQTGTSTWMQLKLGDGVTLGGEYIYIYVLCICFFVSPFYNLTRVSLIRC